MLRRLRAHLDAKLFLTQEQQRGRVALGQACLGGAIQRRQCPGRHEWLETLLARKLHGKAHVL